LPLLGEKARFLLVGAYNTAFGYGVFALLYLLLGSTIHYLAIATASHFLSVANSFFMHRHLVFHDRGPVLAAFLRFNLATAATLAFGLTTMALLVEGGGLSPLLGQAIVLALTTVGSYLLHRHFTFRLRRMG